MEVEELFVETYFLAFLQLSLKMFWNACFFSDCGGSSCVIPWSGSGSGGKFPWGERVTNFQPLAQIVQSLVYVFSCKCASTQNWQPLLFSRIFGVSCAITVLMKLFSIIFKGGRHAKGNFWHEMADCNHLTLFVLDHFWAIYLRFDLIQDPLIFGLSFFL